MKKESLLKKSLSKSLIGFSIGITLLMISYISMYFLGNESLFDSEMYQLHNIKTLILQIMSAGVSGYLLLISIIQCLEIDNLLVSQKPYKATLAMIISFLCLLTTMTIWGNSKIFSKNIRILNLTIMILFYSLACIVFIIKKTIEKYWIKKINKKIQNAK